MNKASAARKAQMFGDGMKDLQSPVSHDFSPGGVRTIFNHIPPFFRQPTSILGKISG
jgi:hypothetical protein